MGDFQSLMDAYGADAQPSSPMSLLDKHNYFGALEDAYKNGTSAQVETEPTVASMARQVPAGINETAMRIAGFPTDATAWAINKGIDAANYGLGTNVGHIERPIGGYQSLVDLTQSVAPAFNPENYPAQNATERIVRAGSGAGAAQAMLPGVGGALERLGASALAPTVAKVVKPVLGKPTPSAVVAATGAGVGGQTGSEIADASDLPPPWKMALTMGGALVGGGIPMAGGALIEHLAEPTTNAATRAQLVAAADRLSRNTGSPVTVPNAVASDHMPVQRIGSILSNVPIAGDPIKQAARRSITQLGEAADNIATSAGSGEVAASGDAMAQGLKTWIGPTSSKRVSDAYDAVDALVNNTVKTDLAATRARAQGILSGRNAAALQGTGGAVNQVMEAITRPDGLTYQGIKTLRTSIGEMINSGLLPADISGGELKQIYGALSEDLKSAARNAGGQDALDAFQRANNLNAQIAREREQLVKVLGGDAANRSDEGVYAALMRAAGTGSSADAKLLTLAKGAVSPSGWSELASGVVSRLGRAPDGAFSPDRFLTAYGKLSDFGKDALFNSVGNVRQSLDDLSTISSKFKQLNQFANPSGTGHMVAGVGGAGALVGHLSTNPSITSVLGSVGAIAGARVLAAGLARPATASALANFSERYLSWLKNPSPDMMQQMEMSAARVSSTFAANFGSRLDPQALIAGATSQNPANAEEQK